ncbi:hypothetical protein [Stenotrophomonas rhizophila]|uniref:Uncharacterized protein n=1 Tax=Stenotrophomonas rhizophila TaxID=216778 RepID=A0AAW5PK52_9GAMM|nr:hypothetical protein [Stenotrophomonas rhizophila]MCS4280131.1 hypothetical protein [Stenotrophomonas rhizophila]
MDLPLTQPVDQLEQQARVQQAQAGKPVVGAIAEQQYDLLLHRYEVDVLNLGDLEQSMTVQSASPWRRHTSATGASWRWNSQVCAIWS